MKNVLLITVAILVLWGCGGGGSDTPAATSPATTPAATSSNSTPSGTSGTQATLAAAEGVYGGSLAGGTQVRVVILENGQTWFVTGTSTASGAFIPTAVSTGQGTFNAGSLSVQFADGVSMLGTFDGAQLVAVVTTRAGAASNLNVSKASISGYNYNQAATVTSIAGGWILNTGALAGSTIAITNTGQLSLSASALGSTCNATLTFTPRASGKNIFDLAASQTGTGCVNVGLVGFGVTYLDTANRQHLVAIAPLPAGAAAPFIMFELSR